MFIAKVVGMTWACQKVKNLDKKKLLIVQPYDFVTGKLYGTPQMAVDSKIDAGPDDIVLVLDEGNSARIILDDRHAPVRTVIAGIVDRVTSQGKNYNLNSIT